MSLANVAYNASLGWADPTLRTLEDLARIPTLNKNHLRASEAALPPFGDYRGSAPDS